jgi:hypothetical protein
VAGAMLRFLRRWWAYLVWLLFFGYMALAPG